MYCKVKCGTILGIKGILIDVEVDVSDGFPKLDFVGLAGNTIKEAKERVRTGIKNSGYNFPYKRITINLAPAHIRKEGVAFDLPIALGILCCEGVFSFEKVAKMMIIGELALNGNIRPVKGVLSLVDEAKKNGLTHCMVPAENYKEASMIDDVVVLPVNNLKDTIRFLKTGDKEFLADGEKDGCEGKANFITAYNTYETLDFSQVLGQSKAKRSIEIAVSGMHHVMMVGPPGVGKTMLSKRVRTILPPLTKSEKVELTKIYSAAEKLMSSNKMIEERPFRNPHHSITRASFLGGSSTGKPGEISLSHQGVLMLDEFPEFKRDVIESLREPLEQGEIILSRNQNVFTFPADFMLIAAMNPCPCGYYPNMSKCTCLPGEISRYQSKLSGPILDRIDIHIELNPMAFKHLKSTEVEETSADILERVKKTHKIQKYRYKDLGIEFNSQLNPELISMYCKVDKEGMELLETAYKSLGLSSRSYHRLLKIARTIADMEGSVKIDKHHIVEAISLRSSIESLS